MNRGRSRGRGKGRGGGGRGRGRGNNSNEESGGRDSGFMDHDKAEGNESSLNSAQGYNFMAELESYKAIKGQERRQHGPQDVPARGLRARSVSSERSTRSTSSYKSTNTKHRTQDGNRMGDTYPIEKWKQMVLKMALELNKSSEETNTDCYFFYYATCSKNTECPFRHEPAAVNSRSTCSYWRQGKCFKQTCTYRHMEFETQRTENFRTETFCYFESQPGGCQKKNCTFKHKKDQDGEYMNEEDERNFGDSSFNEDTVSNTSVSTQQCTKLFVGSKSFANITEDDIRETFSQFGKIVHCNIPKLPDGSNRNFGFVEFGNSDAADKALKQTRKLFIKGNVLHVNRKTEGDKEKGTKLFVGSKSFANITEEDLRKCFSQFGRVVHCNIPKNTDGSNRNFGFVVLENDDAADKAIKQTKNLYIKGNVLNINKRTDEKEENNAKAHNPDVTKKVDNFLEMFRATLTSPNKEGGAASRQLHEKQEDGEIVDNKENLSESENNSKPIFGNKPNIEEENGFGKPITPAIEAIRKRMMEAPGIEAKVEEFLAAVRISVAPPQIQQTGLRKSLADRLSFKNTKNQPPSLSVNEMKNRITSLKQNQQQQHQFSDASGRLVYDPDYLYELQYCDLACVKPANLPRALTRKSLPKQMIQKAAAMANRGRGRGSRGVGGRGGGHGRGGGMQMEDNTEWDQEREMQEQNDINSAFGRGDDIDESMRGGFRGARGRGYLSEEVNNETYSEEERMGQSDVSLGPGVGRGARGRNQYPSRPNESPSGRGRGRGCSPCKDDPQEHSNTAQQHSESQPQNNKLTEDKTSVPKLLEEKTSVPKLLEEKTSVPKLLEENQPVPVTQNDKKRSSEIPDTNLSDTKKPLLEMPQKAEDTKSLPETDILSLIHSARLGQPDTDKNLKSSNKPDSVVDKKDDPLPKTVNEKTLSADAKPFLDPRDQWLQRDRDNERPNWHPDDRWYDERRDPRGDPRYDSPDKYMSQRGAGYDYSQRNDSFRDYDRDWDPRSGPSRDWGYDRNYDEDWEAERRADPKWNEERNARYMWDDRRERSPIRDRGILGPMPGEEEGILGAPPKDSFDRFSDRIDLHKKDWDYNDDREMRDWGPPERTRENLNDSRLHDPWNESFSQQREWDRYPDEMPRDWSPGRLADREDIRNWGPESVSDSYRSTGREHTMGSRRDYDNNSPTRGPDMRGAELTPRWSPAREDSSRMRPDGRNTGIGSPGRRELSRGRSPLPSSEMRNYPLHLSPGRRETSRGRSPLPSTEIRNYPLHPSPSRRDSPRGRSPLPSSESRNYPLHPSPGRRDSSIGKSPLPGSEIRNYPLQKLSPTNTTSKSERSSSPNNSGRIQAVEAPTPGQQRNKSQTAICVKNLPTWSDEQSLKNVLSFEYKKYGQVTRVIVLGTSTDKYAVVCFRKPHEAQEALYDSRNKQVFGQNVVVSVFDGELPPEESKVFTPKSDQEYSQLLVGYKGEEYEALRSILEVHKKECRNYREQPSTHPHYSKEYHAFCLEKQNKILSIGGDPTKYDILPEWKAYWPRRLEELFVDSWQNIKKKCLGSLAAKKEMTPRKSSSSSSKRSRRSPSPRSGSRRSPSPRSGSRRSPSPRNEKSSRRKHKSSHSKSHSSSSRHRDKSHNRRRRSSSRTSTESSSTPRRDRHSERHSEKHKKSRRKRDRSSSRSSSSAERYESKKKSPKKKDKKELPKEDPMEDGEIREDDLEPSVSTLTSTKKENYQDFIKQRMSDVLGHVPESEINESTKLKDKSETDKSNDKSKDKSKKKKSRFPNENYPYTADGTPKVKKSSESKSESKMNKLVSYESEDDHDNTSKGGGGALGALMAQYSEQPASASHRASDMAISPLKICGNIIQIIDILSISDETISSVSQPLKDLYKQAMDCKSSGADPTEVFKDGKAAVNLTSCKLAILAESGTISKTNKKLYQEAQDGIDKLMNVDQHFVEGINIERIAKKTMDMNVSEAIQSIKKELLYINPAENVSEDRVMNLYMEIKKKHLMYLSA